MEKLCYYTGHCEVRSNLTTLCHSDVRRNLLFSATRIQILRFAQNDRKKDCFPEKSAGQAVPRNDEICLKPNTQTKLRLGSVQSPQT